MELKVRVTVVSFTMGTSMGAPAAPWKRALCPSPSGDSEMTKRIVPPLAISAIGGLYTLPGVKTSSVSGYDDGGVIGSASSPHALSDMASVAASAARPTTANRNW